jgi:hypothetical protein
MTATITAESFGRYADQVQEWGGEYTLAVGDRYDIHPGARGGWAVVVVATGRVVAEFGGIDDAVAYAESQD